MSQLFFLSDKTLSFIYNETNASEIDPIVYVFKFCELLKNEIDIFEMSKRNQNPDRYLQLINQIEEFEAKCVENCRKNFETFRQKLEEILKEILALSQYQLTKEAAEKKFEIIKETVKLRRDIFKKNVFFVDRIDDKEIGSLIFIEPFCIDDFQIECIK